MDEHLPTTHKIGEIVRMKGTFKNDDQDIGEIINIKRESPRSPRIIFTIKTLIPHSLGIKIADQHLYAKEIKFMSDTKQKKLRTKLIIKQL